ncbi:P-loop containing nucleoside triphosphate hydrolase protein [Zychaea mexicana]|uniref:P-loop containing nucleoside triphosphate hydrolase protein n=1 Tax=Zychaea mexicana TaxID=64656 RepID=UPI0022FE03BC|nr:P-loop containing nucleoside triphosphate hydrolase protein [Zychaea mexicana]KAI9494500.1 P-loop containing nucleoside triphosphate hydrolase protein [Zychaea mexicana]
MGDSVLKSKKERKEKKDKKEKKEKKEKKDKSEKKRKLEETENDETKRRKVEEKAPESAVDQVADYHYKEHDDLVALPQSEIDTYLKDNSVKIDSDLKLRPITKFAYARLPTLLGDLFKKFESPTPVQAVTWPFALSSRDVVGIAETGSGKTYGFLIPGLIHLAHQKINSKEHGRKPKMVVISPTRELTVQIQEQAQEAANKMGLHSIVVYGGVPKQPQVNLLRRGTDIVIATPGRLMDLMNDGECDLSEISFLVLDEADRMLDEGFERDIRQIIGSTPKERQTLMYSATWPQQIRKLAEDYLNNPTRVTIGSDELSASQRVKQIVQVVPNSRDKQDKLINLLRKIHKNGNRILVFGLYKKECDRVEGVLGRSGFNVAGIHGSKTQVARSEALEGFKKGNTPILIATDVAARGLDIPNVEFVVNLTFPLTIEQYIHRIGRTGRGGKSGTAYTFFSDEDKAHSGELINVLKQANMEVPQELYKYGTTVKKKTHSAYGAFFKDTGSAPKATKIKFD